VLECRLVCTQQRPAAGYVGCCRCDGGSVGDALRQQSRQVGGGLTVTSRLGFTWRLGFSGDAPRRGGCPSGLVTGRDIGDVAEVQARSGYGIRKADDRDRRRAAGIPEEVEFATKPRQAQAMISRAIAVGVPFAWFTADETYGQAEWLQAWLEDQDVSYVMAIGCSDTLTTPAGEQRAGALIAAAPARAWQRISTGAGAHGPREFDWTRIPVRAGCRPGRGHWLLARRSISDPAEIAYYACYGPRRSSTADLAWIAGSRWHIAGDASTRHGCASTGNAATRLPERSGAVLLIAGETGLDHYPRPGSTAPAPYRSGRRHGAGRAARWS
jgi:hypothetical protein